MLALKQCIVTASTAIMVALKQCIPAPAADGILTANQQLHRRVRAEPGPPVLLMALLRTNEEPPLPTARNAQARGPGSDWIPTL